MSHDLIVFGEDYGRHPSSTQHIVRRLAQGRKVVWVNSLGLRRPRLALRDLSRLANKAARLVSRPPAPDVDGQAWTHPFAALVEPRAIPWPGSRLAAGINRALVGRQVAAAMHRCGIDRPVLWTSLPTALPLIGAFGERAVIYYAGDDFAALHGVDHAPVLDMELRLAEKADLILAASAEIGARFDPAKTVHLPHGVDYDLFSTPAAPAPQLPQGKVAGFYGSLNGWIDVEAIARAAKRLPDWTFLLIGRVETDLAALAGLSNVRLHPAVPHAALPAFSQNWTVSLLPFRQTRQIEASNPLKLREYLAAGRPVATTHLFPAVVDTGAPVAAPGPDEGLADAILAAQARETQFRAFARRLQSESWEQRASVVASLIDMF